MKQFYFLLIAVLTSICSFAQIAGSSTIYGYKQKVRPGTVRVDDNGREVPKAPVYNYFIYLASTSKVTPVEIWINGDVYSVTVNEVKTTPVKYSNPTSSDDKPKILVPKTTRRILQLGTSPTSVQKPTAKGKILSAKNELVIIYKGNNKLYYKYIPKLSELEALNMQ